MASPSSTNDHDRWYTAKEAAAYIGYSANHMAHWRMTGEGPTYAKTGSGKTAQVRYRRSDLDAFFAPKMRVSTTTHREPA